MGERSERDAAIWRCRNVAWWCAVACTLATESGAATVAEKARESGCNSKPVAISSGLYKCVTSSGSDAFFNVQASNGVATPSAPERTARRNDNPIVSPPGFPRVDAETQKGRDDLRRKVLSDELAAEEKSLSDARIAYGNGAPAPLPEEQADAEKYRQRIARLRQAVQLHERNIEALRKELGSTH